MGVHTCQGDDGGSRILEYAEPQEFHGFRFVDPGTLREFENSSEFKIPQPGDCAQLTPTQYTPFDSRLLVGPICMKPEG